MLMQKELVRLEPGPFIFFCFPKSINLEQMYLGSRYTRKRPGSTVVCVYIQCIVELSSLCRQRMLVRLGLGPFHFIPPLNYTHIYPRQERGRKGPAAQRCASIFINMEKRVGVEGARSTRASDVYFFPQLNSNPLTLARGKEWEAQRHSGVRLHSTRQIQNWLRSCRRCSFDSSQGHLFFIPFSIRLILCACVEVYFMRRKRPDARDVGLPPAWSSSCSGRKFDSSLGGIIFLDSTSNTATRLWAL
jgi:hypothetical protein